MRFMKLIINVFLDNFLCWYFCVAISIYTVTVAIVLQGWFTGKHGYCYDNIMTTFDILDITWFINEILCDLEVVKKP